MRKPREHKSSCSAATRCGAAASNMETTPAPVKPKKSLWTTKSFELWRQKYCKGLLPNYVQFCFEQNENASTKRHSKPDLDVFIPVTDGLTKEDIIVFKRQYTRSINLLVAAVISFRLEQVGWTWQLFYKADKRTAALHNNDNEVTNDLPRFTSKINEGTTEMNLWRRLKIKKPSVTNPLPKIEKLVYRLAIKTIHLGCTLKCIPYKLENPKDFTTLNLIFSSWYQFLLVTTLLCLHSIAQWIYFLYYTHSHGLNVQACLHLNFLAIYTFSFVFSLAVISKPDAMVDVHKEIGGMQESFQKSWTHHPVIILIVVATRAFFWVVPLICVGLHILDSTLPMFVVTKFLNAAGSDAISITGFGVIISILAATLEAVLLFLSVLTMLSVGQTCAILDIALNIWMQDLRNRMKQTKILNSRTWMSFDTLYRKVQVFSILCNNLWGSIIVPGCTVLVTLLSVSTIYGALRLHGHLHPIVYAFFPILAVFMLGGIVFGIFGQLSKVNQNADACVEEIANEGRKLRALWVWHGDGLDSMLYVRKKSKTLKSFGVQSGSFGYITLSTQVDMVNQIIDYVMLLLSL